MSARLVLWRGTIPLTYMSSGRHLRRPTKNPKLRARGTAVWASVAVSWCYAPTIGAVVMLVGKCRGYAPGGRPASGRLRGGYRAPHAISFNVSCYPPRLHVVVAGDQTHSTWHTVGRCNMQDLTASRIAPAGAAFHAHVTTPTPTTYCLTQSKPCRCGQHHDSGWRTPAVMLERNAICVRHVVASWLCLTYQAL
jgi:hypothetical protein